MIQMKRLNPEVYFADQPIVAVGPEEIGFLQNNVQATARQRTRLCAHQSPEESLHEMFVVYTNSTYMRPNKHPKEESLHILGGSADFVFFDQVGNVTDVVQLGALSSGRPYYCRVPRDTYHTVLIRSERLTIHEGLTGPFRQDSTTVFAPWAPEENDAAGVEAFSERLEGEVARQVAGKPPASLRMARQSSEVFLSDEPVSKFGQREMEILRDALPRSSRRRVRVCMHNGVDDPFQEMFIVFSKGSYLPASKHLGKDESVNVVEGKADFVLFDEAGKITNVIPVGDQSTGLPFYLRTPHERYHAWIVRSDVFAVHQTTEGPFRREDTVLAPWSPADVNDPIAVPRYQEQLEMQTTQFVRQTAETASCA
jgi:cupin fold WbuC family metalloprotein